MKIIGGVLVLLILLVILGMPLALFYVMVIVPAIQKSRCDKEETKHPIEDNDAGRFELHIISSHQFYIRDSKTGIVYPELCWPKLFRPLDERALHKVVILKDHCLTANVAPRRWYLTKVCGWDPKLDSETRSDSGDSCEAF